MTNQRERDGMGSALLWAGAGMAIGSSSMWISRVRKAHGRTTKFRWFMLAFIVPFTLAGGLVFAPNAQAGSSYPPTAPHVAVFGFVLYGIIGIILSPIPAFLAMWLIEMYDRATGRKIFTTYHWATMDEVHQHKEFIWNTAKQRLGRLPMDLLLMGVGVGGFVGADLVLANGLSKAWTFWSEVEQTLQAGGNYGLTD